MRLLQRRVSLFTGLIDFIEDAAVVEVGLLCLLPVAHNLSEGEELHVWELLRVFRQRFFVLRAEVVLGGDFLAFGV